MAKIKHLFFFFILFNLSAQSQQISVGAEQTDKYLDLLKNKRVGVIANHTSLINKVHIVDSLLDLEIKIVKIFSPEHGFRGNEDAGKKINDGIDKKTNLKIISLYGKNKKPKTSQLEDLDVLVFDIQDVGVRFYTYLSTLHYIIQAAGENNIDVIVLDRPNPNISYIDGPVLEREFSSFVGLHPVPILYGMTIGEYAKMINGENWAKSKCNLTVIPIENYSREKAYDLPVRPSPNLPNSKSINLYASLCLFEGTSISVGRGTEYPFQHFGSPLLESNYSFVPVKGYGSSHPKHENKKCYGLDLRYIDIHLTEINLKWLINCYREIEDKSQFFNKFFDKLAGTNKLRQDIIKGLSDYEIKKSWEKDIANFNKIRKKYLIYD